MSFDRHQPVTRSSPVAPPFGPLWREAMALADFRRRLPRKQNSIHFRGAEGAAPLMVIPGFLAGDMSTEVLRAHLATAGYRVHGWGQGLNMGASEARLERLARDVSRLAKRH